MPCICEICKGICTCGERFCPQCFLDVVCEDDTERDIYLGGHFSEISLLKEDSETSVSANE